MKYASATLVVLVAWAVGILLAALSDSAELRQKFIFLLQFFTLAIFFMVFARRK